MKIIQLFKPSFGKEELEALKGPFRSGWIGLGPKTAEFEKEFAQYVKAKYAIAVNSCTAALHLALIAFDIKRGDDVLVPSITFVSTVNAILYAGATPVFVDVEYDTLCISIDDLKNKITKKTKAIIPVHYGGHPCEMDQILDITKRYNLIVIEDAAHACGAEYKGRKIGSIGNATCFSFHAVKNLATGDGGMVTTDNLEIVEKLKRLRWVGIDKDTWHRTRKGEEEIKKAKEYIGYDWYYEIHELGYKCHMNDITAAIGLVQLKKLDRMNAKRRKIVEQYNNAFKKIKWIEAPVEKDYVRSAHHNYVIKTPYRDALNLYLKGNGIASGVHYMPIHLQPYYKKRFSANVPVTEKVWKKLLTLPLYPDLTYKDFIYITESIKKFKSY